MEHAKGRSFTPAFLKLYRLTVRLLAILLDARGAQASEAIAVQGALP